MVQLSFKNISYLKLWWRHSSLQWNHLCNFGRRHHEEQFCEIILKLDQWLRVFKGIFDLALERSGTIYAILVEGIMRNNFVKLF